MRTQDTIELLNRLIRTCRSGEEFCRIGSARVAAAYLHALLRHGSGEWGRLGDELQALVLLLDGAPALEPALGARVRQWWFALKCVLPGSHDRWVLAEWEHAQQQALQHYERALNGYLPERIRRTLILQADRVMDRRDQIGSLRGHYAIRSQGA